MSQNILDLIDGVVDTWESSPDAMRWSPERETADSADAWAAAVVESVTRIAWAESFRLLGDRRGARCRTTATAATAAASPMD